MPHDVAPNGSGQRNWRATGRDRHLHQVRQSPGDHRCCRHRVPGFSRVEALEIETRALAYLDPEAAMRAHFFAAATFQLQQPSRLPLSILKLVRASVTETLAPHARPIEDLRRDVVRATNGDQRVASRTPAVERSHVPHWPWRWAMTAHDVGAAPDDAYQDEVAHWARATLSDVERAETA